MIELYNIYHLGDCTWQVHYMRKMCDAFQVSFNFYCCKEYHSELQAQIGLYSNRIILKDINEKTSRAVDTWINSNSFLMRHGQRSNYNQVYADFFIELNRKIGLPKYEFTKDFLVFDNEAILNEPTENKYDILLINSEPKSGQFQYKKDDFEYLITLLYGTLKNDKYYNIITTSKYKNVPCTQDTNMNLLEIASLSKHVDYVIGVHTAPLLMCFNKWNIDTVKHWYVCDGYHGFTYNDRITRHETFINLISKLQEDKII